MDNNGKVEADVNSRIEKASSMFQRLCLILSMSTISLRPKIHLNNTFITLIATYARETWKMTLGITKKLYIFQLRYLHRILGVRYWDKVTNEATKREEEETCHANHGMQHSMMTYN